MWLATYVILITGTVVFVLLSQYKADGPRAGVHAEGPQVLAPRAGSEAPQVREDSGAKPDVARDTSSRETGSEHRLGPLSPSERESVAATLSRRAKSFQLALDGFRERMDASSTHDIDQEAELALWAAKARATLIAFESSSYYVVSKISSLEDVPGTFVFDAGCVKDGQPATARIIVRDEPGSDIAQRDTYVQSLRQIRLNQAVLAFNRLSLERRKALIDRSAELHGKSSLTPAEETEQRALAKYFPHGVALDSANARLRVARHQ